MVAADGGQKPQQYSGFGGYFCRGDSTCGVKGEWSSPRKEKNSKPPTRENLFPRKRTIRVNPNGGKQGGIPEKESLGIANPKVDLSGCQTELVLRCPRENSNEDPSWRQNKLIPRHQRKRRGIPKNESPEIFTPKYDPSWLQKEINSEVPEG